MTSQMTTARIPNSRARKTSRARKALSATLAAVMMVGTLAATVAPAEARNGRNAAGIAGFAAGALIGAALAQRPVAQSTPVYYGRPRPWSAEWYAYCADRYRSFDPDSGTYISRSGRERFCR